MPIPEAAAARIRALGALADPAAVARSAQALSRAYRAGLPGVRSEDEAFAYAVSRMPATCAAAERALSLSLACAPARPDTLTDCGAGTGAMTLAACGLLPIRAAVCLEREPAMRALGRELTAAAGIPAEWKAFDVTGGGPLPKAALVCEGYMLCELPEDRRIPAARAMWAAAEQMLLLTEPGTPAGFRILRAVREALLREGAHTAAPCPGDGPCGLPDGDWCHFTARLPRDRLMKRAKGGDAPFEDEKFAFLALTRESPAPCAARILRHPRIAPGRVALSLCGAAGPEERAFTKKDPLWKRVRKADAGDALPGG